ncbi:MAG: ELWxxDGT repeat protein [Candidatus Limnocylindrus sp.]
MPARKTRRAALLALTLLLAVAVPVRAGTPPPLTVVEINPGADSSYAMDASTSVALDGYLYFSAYDGTHGEELWRTNGTTTGLVQDINTGANDSYPRYFTALGDWLYFRANDGTLGYELWRTNGTTTALVQDIYTGANDSSPYYFTAFGDWLYFQASDDAHGYELWRTNGTTTALVQDIWSGADKSSPYYFTALGDWLYFGADDGTHGYELWRTNGTDTALVQDIWGGADGSSPDYFTALGDWVYFRASDGTHDRGLWRTDGTTTERVPFPTAGVQSECDECYDTSITAVGGRLYTIVYSAAIGHEFAYLDEPSYVLPSTNTNGTSWSEILAITAALTAAAGVTLRLRGRSAHR